MRELAGSGIVGVPEAYGLGEKLDLCFVSREEVPSARASGTTVKSRVQLVFYLGKDRAFAGIDTHGHNGKISADFEGQFFCAAQNSVQNLGAQHRALVIHERQNDRLFSKKVPQGHGLAVLVAKREIERNRITESLIQSNVAQQLRAHTCGLHGAAILKLSSSRSSGEQTHNGRECQKPEARRPQFHWPNPPSRGWLPAARFCLGDVPPFSGVIDDLVGRPRCKMSSMARSMGRRTIPFWRSIQP